MKRTARGTADPVTTPADPAFRVPRLSHEEQVEAISVLGARTILDHSEMLTLAWACRMQGQYVVAERWARAALHQHSPLAHVEYLALLMLRGRDRELIVAFERAAPLLVDEDLRLRARRYLGIARHRLGQRAEGLALILEAWNGSTGLQRWGDAADAAQNLGVIHAVDGQFGKAEEFLLEARRLYELDGDSGAGNTDAVLYTLASMYLDQGRLAEFHEAMEAHGALPQGQRPRNRALRTQLMGHYLRLTGDYPGYVASLITVHEWALESDQFHILHCTANDLADHFSAVEDYASAWRTLHQVPRSVGEPLPPEVQLGVGLVLRRQRNHLGAISALQAAVDWYSQRADRENIARSLLELAYAHHQHGDWVAARAPLLMAVEQLMRGSLFSVGPVLADLRDLFYRAAMDSATAAYVEPIRAFLRDRHIPQSPIGVEQVHVEVIDTPRVRHNHRQVGFDYRDAPTLLAFLKLNPASTREQMQVALFPDRDPASAGAYVRKAVAELREQLGAEVILTEGGTSKPTYRIGNRFHVSLDLQSGHEALTRGDLAEALAMLGQRNGQEGGAPSWLDEQRAALVARLATAVRDRLAELCTQRDWRGAILLASLYLESDSDERAVHLTRIEAAQQLGLGAELAGYRDSLRRLDDLLGQ